jgi:general secretion pathway protein L
VPGTLLLTIPDSAPFDAETPIGWTLIERNATREGRDPLAQTPQADRIVGVAPVARILYLETALPPVSRTKRNALLNYAIEDKLTIDPDTVHATVLGESREAEHVVAVVDKQWLTDALTWLKAGGRAPQALVCEADAIAAKPGEWVVAPGAPHGFARRDDGFVLHLDTVRPDEVPFSLGLSLNEARNKGRLPAALALALPHERMGDAAALCAAWQSALGVPVHAELRNGGAALALAASRANLLTGDFSPQRESTLDRAFGKPVALLLAAMVLIHLAFGAIDLARMKSERERRIVAMTAAFRDVFPDAQTVVDAPLQMQRKLAELKRERGVADVDAPRRAIEAMAAFAAREAGISPAPELMSISIAEGRVRTKWRVGDAAQLAPFMAAANAAGTFAVERVDEPSARQVVLTMRVER